MSETTKGKIENGLERTVLAMKKKIMNKGTGNKSPGLSWSQHQRPAACF